MYFLLPKSFSFFGCENDRQLNRETIFGQLLKVLKYYDCLPSCLPTVRYRELHAMARVYSHRMHPVLADCSAFSENNVHVFTWKCVVRLFISLLFAFRVLVFVLLTSLFLLLLSPNRPFTKTRSLLHHRRGWFNAFSLRVRVHSSRHGQIR